jgi:hypothetical protein
MRDASFLCLPLSQIQAGNLLNTAVIEALILVLIYLRKTIFQVFFQV